MNKPKIRTTHLSQFLTCPAAYAYGQKTGPSLYAPFIYGSLGHYCLEYSDDMSPDVALEQWLRQHNHLDSHYLSKAESLFPRITETIDHYHAYWQWKTTYDDSALKYEVLQREEQFSYEEETYYYTGKYDGLVTVGDELYLLEYKFVKDTQRYRQSIPSALQPYAYLHYMREYYPDLVGVVYDLICKTPVSYPQRYKSKSVKYKYKLKPAFHATYPFICDFFERDNERVDERILAYCTTKEYEESCFTRFIFAPSNRRLDEMMGIIKRESLRFVESLKENNYEKRPTYWSCGRCDHKLQCQGR